MPSPLVLLLLFSALVGLLCSPTVAETNVLFNRDILKAGKSLTNGSFRLTMEHDCNLFLYKNHVPIWMSNTYRPAGVCHLRVSEKGVLVIAHLLGLRYTPIWSCGKETQKSTYALLLGGDGSLGTYGPAISTEPLNTTTGYKHDGILYPGSKAGSGSILRVGENELLMDEYCRLVSQIDGRGVVWASPPAPEIKGDKCNFEFTTSGQLVTSYLVNIGMNVMKKVIWTNGILTNREAHISALPDLSVLPLKQLIASSCGKLLPPNIAIGERRADH